MKATSFLLFTFLAAACVLASFPHAAGSRTIIVPENYATLSEAVQHAQSGDTIYVKEGTYDEPDNQTVTINKTLSIIGENAQNTTINFYPAYTETWILTACFTSCDDALAINADDCKLVGLTLVNYHGGAISAVGNRLQVTGNSITNNLVINGSNCNIAGNTLREIRFSGSHSNLTGNSVYSISVEGSSNLIKNNACSKVGLANGAYNVVTYNEIKSDYGYNGVELRNCSNNVLYRNELSGFGYGVELWQSSNNQIVANSLTDCHVGSFAVGGAFNNHIYLNNIKNGNWYDRYFYDFYSDRWVRNGTPSMIMSKNFWDNGSFGNYWANYNGTDKNWDGVGDEPYVLKLNLEHFEGPNTEVTGDSDNYPLMKPVDIYTVTAELPPWTVEAGTEAANPPQESQQTATPQPTTPTAPNNESNQPNQQTTILLGAVTTAVLVAAITVVILKKNTVKRETPLMATCRNCPLL